MSTIRTSYDPSEIDTDRVIALVQKSYWGVGRDAIDIRLAIGGSFCVTLHDGFKQIAFARAVSDAVFSAFIFDVFVEDAWRGQGLGLRLMQDLMNHPRLKTVKSWMLHTKDAHGLYAKLGFERVDPDRLMWMERS